MRNGEMQGDMKPEVKDYQMPRDAYSMDGSKTLNYIERQDRQQKDNGRQIRKQEYKGRYD